MINLAPKTGPRHPVDLSRPYYIWDTKRLAQTTSVTITTLFHSPPCDADSILTFTYNLPLFFFFFGLNMSP